jgi:putative MATE family efflux protein
MSDKRKDIDLGNEPVKKLLWRLSLPALTGMVVMALYNIVDTIFVGQGVGPLGIAGLTIAFPVQMIITSFAMAVGVGGASVVSRSLGAENPDKAAHAAANVLGLAFGMGAVVALLGYFYLEPLLIVFGATEEILPYAGDYLGLVVLSSPFLSLAMAGNNLMRAEGRAKMAMWTMLIAAVVNLTFDPIFIFVFELGMRGAALATILSHLSAGAFMLGYFLLRRSSLHIVYRHLLPRWRLIKEIAAIGISSFSRQAAGAIIATLLNHSLGLHGGDLAIAAYGLIGRILMLTFMPLIGFAQGFQPIAGFNFGAGKIARVREVLLYALRVSLVTGFIGFLLMMLFPRYIFLVFSDDEQLLSLTVDAIRTVVILFPIIGLQTMGATFFQALGKAGSALILTLSRQVLFFIPILLVMAPLFGLDGIWMTFPISDLLSTFVTGFLLWRELKRLQKKIEV